MTQALNPVVQQRRLRAELRRARDQAHLTQKEAAEALEWSPSKVIRIETGAVGIAVTDLRAMLALYKITDQEQIEGMLDMARSSKARSWWDKYKEYLHPEFIQFLALQESASDVRQFQFLFIPGLLQTKNYAESMFASYQSDPVASKARTEARMKRQELLSRKDAPRFSFVLDESTLRRRIGSAAVMREQLEHLKKVNELPNVCIYIFPFSAGVRPGMQIAFSVLEFPADIDYVVQIEGVSRDTLIENEPETASEYVENFTALEALSIQPDKFDETIDQLIAELPT